MKEYAIYILITIGFLFFLVNVCEVPPPLKIYLKTSTDPPPLVVEQVEPRPVIKYHPVLSDSCDLYLGCLECHHIYSEKLGGCIVNPMEYLEEIEDERP